jgi:malate synthase
MKQQLWHHLIQSYVLLQGQVNMQGAAKGKLEFRDPKSGKTYKLGDTPATLKASVSVVVRT